MVEGMWKDSRKEFSMIKSEYIYENKMSYQTVLDLVKKMPPWRLEMALYQATTPSLLQLSMRRVGRDKRYFQVLRLLIEELREKGGYGDIGEKIMGEKW